MLGVLVHGDNHFIVSGPSPDQDAAYALVRHWTLIEIGAAQPQALAPWRIVSRAFRENLEWAVVVGTHQQASPAVSQLLAEMSQRGISIHYQTGLPELS